MSLSDRTTRTNRNLTNSFLVSVLLLLTSLIPISFQKLNSKENQTIVLYQETGTVEWHNIGDKDTHWIYRGEGKNPRRLTPREVFRLQGFPESFKFTVSDLQAYKQAGNAVPINVVEKVCSSVINYLENNQKNILINKKAS